MSNMPRKLGVPYGLPAIPVGDRTLTRNLGPSGPRGFKRRDEGCSMWGEVTRTFLYLLDSTYEVLLIS
jgi:hypothetical protein